MKKNFLTCGGIALIFFVVLIVGIVIGFNALQNSFRTSLLQELGFSSEEEYDDFVTVMHKPFDESSFYENLYSNEDETFVKNAIKENVQLIDNSPIFNDKGYLNIEGLDKENNTVFLNSIEFSQKQFAYFETLMLTSILSYDDLEKNEFNNAQILEYKILNSTTHIVTLKLETQQLKSNLGDFKEALPDNLYCTIQYDIIKVNNEYQATNQSIQFNKLDETYNEKCIKFFNGLLQNHPAKVFSDLIITLINSFDNSTNSKTTFTENTIIIGGAKNE